MIQKTFIDEDGRELIAHMNQFSECFIQIKVHPDDDWNVGFITLDKSDLGKFIKELQLIKKEMEAQNG